MARTLVDGHGRTITYVRISVTDRCNLRCVYCMPEDQKFRPLPHLMTREEIRRAARLLASFGVSKIRITGGEPTTRPDLVGIVGDLAAIGFPSGIALSTNGVLFPRMAHDLLAAGLTKVNVSLDAAEAEHFQKLTRRDHVAPVLRVDRSRAHPSVRLGEDQLRRHPRVQRRPDPATRGDDPGEGARRPVHRVHAVREQRLEGDRLDGVDGGPRPPRRRGLRPDAAREVDRGRAGRRIQRPVRPWGAHRGTIGFITPISDRFCDTCNRMRPDAGRLPEGVPLRAQRRRPAPADARRARATPTSRR